jgi:hypothetical protein
MVIVRRVMCGWSCMGVAPKDKGEGFIRQSLDLAVG